MHHKRPGSSVLMVKDQDLLILSLNVTLLGQKWSTAVSNVTYLFNIKEKCCLFLSPFIRKGKVFQEHLHTSHLSVIDHMSKGSWEIVSGWS